MWKSLIVDASPSIRVLGTNVTVVIEAGPSSVPGPVVAPALMAILRRVVPGQGVRAIPNKRSDPAVGHQVPR
jgi:hypothetical protein